MELMETNQASFDCSNLENPILASSLLSYGEIMLFNLLNEKSQSVEEINYEASCNRPQKFR